MKKNTLIILGVVLVASTVAVVVKRRGVAATFSEKPAEVGQILLKNVPYDKIESLKIADAKHEVEIAKKEGKWVVTSRDNWPANVTAVNELTDSGLNLKVQRVEKGVGASQMPRLGLALKGTADVKPEDTGRTVAFNAAGGAELGSLVVGKNLEVKDSNPMSFDMNGPRPVPQWIKVQGQDAIYVVATGFSRLEADPKGWLNKDKFFKVEKLKYISVAGPTPEDSWKVFRETETGELKLDAPKEGEELDAGKAAGAGSAFSFVSFDDILPAAEKDKAGLDKPTYTATIETFTGLTYTVKVGAKAPAPEGDSTERYYVSFVVGGKLDETPPPYAAVEPKAPAEPAAPAADAGEEAKKKYDEDKKKYEADKAKYAEEKKKWEDGKKAAEDLFKSELKTRQETLAQEQGLKDRIFIVAKSPALDPVIKKRADLMKDKAAAPAEGATSGAGGATSPPVSISPVANPPSTGRIEATTPPIEVTIPPKDATKDAPTAESGGKDAVKPK